MTTRQGKDAAGRVERQIRVRARTAAATTTVTTMTTTKKWKKWKMKMKMKMKTSEMIVEKIANSSQPGRRRTRADRQRNAAVQIIMRTTDRRETHCRLSLPSTSRNPIKNGLQACLVRSPPLPGPSREVGEGELRRRSRSRGEDRRLRERLRFLTTRL
jgi:hypothetical protein